MNRAITMALLSVCYAGCGAIVPTPTAPSVSWSPAVSTAIALQLVAPAAPDLNSGVAHIAVLATSAEGNPASAIVSCSASSGRVTPGPFDARAQGAIELAGAITPAHVSCRNADLSADVDVDMSAWWIVLDGNQYVPLGDGAGQSRVVVTPQRRIRGIEPTRVQLDWGDGTPIDVLPYVPASTSATRFHRYARAGHYVMRGRIEWPGGSHEARLSVDGGPAGNQP